MTGWEKIGIINRGFRRFIAYLVNCESSLAKEARRHKSNLDIDDLLLTIYNWQLRFDSETESRGQKSGRNKVKETERSSFRLLGRRNILENHRKSRIKRVRKSGFRARMRTRTGRKILSKKRQK